MYKYIEYDEDYINIRLYRVATERLNHIKQK